jgi:geranylgeranyl pyrophosphate synthase
VIEDLADDNALRPMVCFQQSLLRALDCSQLTGGQALDLAAKTEGILSSRRLAEKKTAPLFALAAHAGALGAPDRDRRLVTRFGLEFGVLYQFLDDLSDGHLQSEHVFRAQEERTRDLLRPFGSRAAELIDMVEMLSARAAA